MSYLRLQASLFQMRDQGTKFLGGSASLYRNTHGQRSSAKRQASATDPRLSLPYQYPRNRKPVPSQSLDHRFPRLEAHQYSIEAKALRILSQTLAWW